MPEFEILWAPLSRKWQVWQRESDQSGCAVETLLGEYPSEGRARHEAALLRGDLPAGTAYEVPRGRRWFSLRGRGRSKASQSDAGSTQAAAKEPGDLLLTATSGSMATQIPVDDSRTATASSRAVGEWQAGLIQRLELVRQHAEKHEVESIRRILEEALLVVPETAENERAA